MGDIYCRHQKEAKLPESENQEDEYFREILKIGGADEITYPYLCEETNKKCVGYEHPAMEPNIEIMRRCPSFMSVDEKGLEEQIKKDDSIELRMLTGMSPEEISIGGLQTFEEQWKTMMDAKKRLKEEDAKYVIQT